MKFILRRAKDTDHFVVCENQKGSLYVIGDFPVLLFALSLFSTIGFAASWVFPIVFWLIATFLYEVYRQRQPWEGEKLEKVKAFKVKYH